MVKFLIYRPIGVIVLFIAAIILGVIAYSTLPVSLMPNIPIPQVTVNVEYQNISARELEDGIIKQIRSQLMQVQHLNEIKSKIREGRGVINLIFDYGTDVDYAFIEVNEKVDAIMNSMPRDMERPKVLKASATDIPVFYINLSLKNADGDASSNQEENGFIQLSNFAESVIKKRIEQLSEVAMIDITGTVSPQLVIEPYASKIQSLNLSIDEIENALAENNINIGSLTIRDGQYQYNLRFTALLRTVRDVENIHIRVANKVFRLSDLAYVKIEEKKQDGLFESDGTQAISMAVIKQANSRLSDMQSKVTDLMNSLENDYPEIQFEISQDQTQLLNYSIANLKQNLSQGMLLVILVVFLFLKDIKLAVIIGISLLVSITISLLFFKLAGLSINIISLAGLILAIGNMMDNSIVVVDNIIQYREKNFSIEDACIAGTNEIWLPQLSSMLVNVVVFLPLIFLSGIAGALMYEEAIAVTIGLAVSFLVGIILIPVLFRLLYVYYFPSMKLQHIKKLIFSKVAVRLKLFNVEELYKRGLNFTFRYKKLNILLYLLILPLGIYVFFIIKKEKIPTISQTETYINIDWNENINIDENKSRVTELINVLKSRLIHSEEFIGHQQFLLNSMSEMEASEAKIYVKVSNPDKIRWIQKNTVDFISKKFPATKIEFELPTSIFEKIFGSSDPPLIAEISMTNSEREFDIPEVLKLCHDLNDHSNNETVNQVPLRDYIVIYVDLEKLSLYKVSLNAVIKELKLAFKEHNVGLLRSYKEYLPIVIANQEKSIPEIIATTKVYNKDRNLISISAFVKISRNQELKTIIAGKEGEYIPLNYFPSSSSSDVMISKISDKIIKSKAFQVHFSGSLFATQNLLKELSVVLLISILLLYFILAAQFESLVQPLIVLLEIPLSVGAAIVTLYITGQSMNLMSAAAIVVMLGIIITDSILKLDAINQLRKNEGYSVIDAIHEGGRRRLRAILMTSLTSILAMIPLLFSNDIGSELQKPFSYALIGGMTFGTLVSLYLVPLIYWYVYRNKKQLSKQ